MTFFLLALVLGLLCTQQRRLLWSRWAGVAVCILLAIALPNLLWQAANHWPTLEFLHNGRIHDKNTVLDPLHFFLAQCLMLGPINILVWIPGLVALLRAKTLRDGRWLAFTYCIFYILMDALHAKDYYLGPIYPMLFAAGAVAWERRADSKQKIVTDRLLGFPVLESLLLLIALLILPMSSPVLPPARWVRYTHALHMHHAESETFATGPLPQFFADRFGWNQDAALVVRAYRLLTPDEQQHVCIFGSDYGEAGAVDLLGPRLQPGLPAAISGQNSYWMWGLHGCDPNTVIAIVADTQQQLQQKYKLVDSVGHIESPYAMPFEQRRSVWILRGRKSDAPFHWSDERRYF